MYSCVKAGNSALTCYCKGDLQKTRNIDSARQRQVNGWTIKLFFLEMQRESGSQVIDSSNHACHLVVVNLENARYDPVGPAVLSTDRKANSLVMES